MLGSGCHIRQQLPYSVAAAVSGVRTQPPYYGDHFLLWQAIPEMSAAVVRLRNRVRK